MKRGWVAWLLLPLSLLFRMLSGLRRLAYRVGLIRAERLPVPVVVVGNLYVGGTGKTPLAVWLVQALRARGYRPGVVSRGYGRGAGDARLVRADDALSGDEPRLIAARTGVPVAVGARRAEAARLLLQAHPEVDLIVADDGLQHLALARDVEIALVDERGRGNGWLLPAGPLREPWSRLATVDAIVTRVEASEAWPSPAFRMHLDGDAAVPLRGGTPHPLRDFAGRRILAAAGIGQPARFFRLLRAHGLAPRELPLPDHYDFARNPFAEATEEIVMITEKDAVKCRPFDDPRIWVVPIEARVDTGLVDLVVEKLRGSPAA